jgi:hypothetical protein
MDELELDDLEVHHICFFVVLSIFDIETTSFTMGCVLYRWMEMKDIIEN